MLGYRLPLQTTIIIGIQMVMGGIIVGKDAGFICPDWPLCHGQVLPKMTGLVVLELVHRFSALLVAVLVLWTTVTVLRRARTDAVMVRIVVWSLVSLALQIVVGGFIVIWKLPGITTTIDVLNSMFLLAMYVLLTGTAYARWRAVQGRPLLPDGALHRLRRPAAVVLVTLGLAIAVGAIFRHTGASQSLFHEYSYLASHGQTSSPSLALSTALLAIHVVTGGLVALVVVWLVSQAFVQKRAVRLSLWLAALVLLQIVFGMISLGTRLDIVSTTLHWTNAAVLVALTTYIVFRAHMAKPDDGVQSV